jgi:hypothetical protein
MGRKRLPTIHTGGAVSGTGIDVTIIMVKMYVPLLYSLYDEILSGYQPGQMVER